MMKASELETLAAKIYNKIYPQLNYYRASWQQRQKFLDIARLELK